MVRDCYDERLHDNYNAEIVYYNYNAVTSFI